MKSVILLLSISTLLMSGWNAEDENKQAENKEKEEAARLCEIYKIKIEKYKKTIRDDELARTTLKNYERVKNKYCNFTTKENNSTL